MLYDNSNFLFFEEDTKKTHYRIFNPDGNNRIVVLPDFFYPSSVYYPFCDLLSSNNFSVCTLDYFGRGNSEISCEKPVFNCQLYANQVIALLGHINWNNITIVGISYGSIIIDEILKTKSTLFSKCIHISPNNGLRSCLSYFMKAIMPLKKVYDWYIPRFLPHNIPRFVYDEMSNPVGQSQLYWTIVSSLMHQINTNKSFYPSLSYKGSEKCVKQVDKSHIYLFENITSQIRDSSRISDEDVYGNLVAIEDSEMVVNRILRDGQFS